MNNEQNDTVIAGLKRTTKSKTPYFWSFTAKGADGAPVLIVGKRENEVVASGKTARKGAADAKNGRGRVIVDSGGKLVFGLEEGNAAVTLVQKALRMELAQDPAVKPVKPLLLQARVVEADEFASLVGGAAPRGVDLASLKVRLEAARALSKGAYEAAVARAGASHPDIQALAKLADEGRATRKAALDLEAKDPEQAVAQYQLAVSLYEEIIDTAEAAGLEVEEVEGSDEEAQDLSSGPDRGGRGGKASEVDVNHLLEVFTGALDEVGGQLEKLRGALLGMADPELRAIAEFGLNKLTAGHRTKVQSALFNARNATGDQRDAALVTVAAHANAFLDHLEDERFDAVDQNPFGVAVTARKTLGGALRKLASAA